MFLFDFKGEGDEFGTSESRSTLLPETSVLLGSALEKSPNK